MCVCVEKTIKVDKFIILIIFYSLVIFFIFKIEIANLFDTDENK